MREWLKSINEEGTKYSSNRRICSDHFDVDDFVFIGRRKNLKPNAIPKLKSVQNSALLSSAPTSHNFNFTMPNSALLQISPKKVAMLSESLTSGAEEVENILLNVFAVPTTSKIFDEESSSSLSTVVDEDTKVKKRHTLKRRRQQTVPSTQSLTSSSSGVRRKKIRFEHAYAYV